MKLSDEYKPKVGGRPTKYKKSFDLLIQEMSAKGASVVQFAAHVGVGKSTVYDWVDQKRGNFPDAFARARTLAEAYWEEKYMTDMRFGGKDVQASMWARKMATQFGWYDKQQENDQGGSDGDILITIAPAVKPEE